MARSPRSTRKRLAPVALLAFVALALTGCMRVHMDLDVKADDTVSGTAVLAVSDSLIDLMGSEAEGLFEDSPFDGEEGVTVEEYAEDGYTGQTYHFAQTPLDEFSEDDMSITRDGDEFVMSGKLDLSEGASEVPESMMDGFDVRVTVTFPGEIIETNGKVSGTTVTWEPAVGEVNEMTARASAVSTGGGVSAGLIIGIVVAVVVVAAIVVLVLVTRKKQGAAGDPTALAQPPFAPYAGPQEPVPGGPTPVTPPVAAQDAAPDTAPPVAPTPPQAQDGTGPQSAPPAPPA